MEYLDTYDHTVGGADDNLRLQQLLDMARGIYDRSPSSADAVARELGHYAQYNGGTYGMFHVARRGQRIEAMAHTAWFRDSLQFNALAVSPELRGQGVAKRIIYTLAQEAIARDIDDLWVYALRNSRASQIYAHLGMSVPPPGDERHPQHGRYHPMSASPRELVAIAGEVQPFVLRGSSPRLVVD